MLMRWRSMRCCGTSALVCLAVVGLLGNASTGLEIETVPIGNPGNPGQLSGIGAGGYGPNGICGALDHTYRIGRYPTAEYNNAGFRVRELVLADFDNDGDVDSADLDMFKACFSGPAIPYDAECGSMDLDGEGDVDQSDFGIFQQQYRPSGRLSIIDADGFVSMGDQGGPYAPESKTYTLANTGGWPIAWSATATQAWVTLSKQGGTLAAGATDTVEVSINSIAHGSDAGSHSDILTFTNTANHNGDTTRAVNLTINPPGMAFIPAGEFQMGSSLVGDGDCCERHAVWIDAFFMARTEVTNQQYANALNWAYGQGNLITVTNGEVFSAGSGRQFAYCSTTAGSAYYSKYSGITWDGTTFGVVLGRENHPIVLVRWHGAAAYANWRSAIQGKPLCYNPATGNCNFGSGYRLPTEAEWEKAARGGADGHRFPWSDSDEIQHARANYNSISSFSYDTSPTPGYHPTFNTGVYLYTSPVGYFAANGYGLYDMAGNVWEWCNDWFSESYCDTGPTNNPRGPASGTYRVLRGGSWDSGAEYCRVACRYYYNPTYPVGTHGFRLVLSAE